ncbi:kelch domain-containing protein 8A-like [Dendronephthya gigantea]|uniref:kelch domain-containing protein 8A-like n=1 Tax=Dendronephthya gigantea TaxID=151771 RepID=UPI00106C00F7|nr:kelch domain-containing protein 8A-like [Dendronephthya gigantea]
MRNEIRESNERTTAIDQSRQNLHTPRCVILVIAGQDPTSREPVSSVEGFDLFSQIWNHLPALKTARYCHASVIFNNKILVCGGLTTSSYDDPTDSIEVFDLDNDPQEWKRFAVNLPIKVAAHKCVVYEDRLLIVGGADGKEFFDTIYELRLVPPYSSRLLCRMKKKRALHGVELFDDKLLIAGGMGAETDVEIYDITSNQCFEMPPLPSPVYQMATVRRDESMLLIGGIDKNGEVSNEIIGYESKTGWSEILLVMEDERASCLAVLVEDTLVVVDGAVQDEVKGKTDCFNFLPNSWTSLPSLSEIRCHSTAVVVNNAFCRPFTA